MCSSSLLCAVTSTVDPNVEVWCSIPGLFRGTGGCGPCWRRRAASWCCSTCAGGWRPFWPASSSALPLLPQSTGRWRRVLKASLREHSRRCRRWRGRPSQTSAPCAHSLVRPPPGVALAGGIAIGTGGVGGMSPPRPPAMLSVRQGSRMPGSLSLTVSICTAAAACMRDGE